MAIIDYVIIAVYMVGMVGIGFLFAGLVAPVLALPVTLVCIIAALLVMKNISRKRAAVAA